MIDIEIDGIYCKKCNDLHPTLFWHDLYDDYIESEGDYICRMKNLAKIFDGGLTEDEVIKLYYKKMADKELVFCSNAEECAVCKTKTHYMHTKTKCFVCSDKCRYTICDNDE